MISWLWFATFTGCNALGPYAAKFVPILEKFNEEWAPIEVDCSPNYSSRKPRNCITRDLKCGDEIQGNNRMGRATFDDDFYRAATCYAISPPGGHSGPEMVYRLKVPARHNAYAKLVSDCGDLDVMAMRWNDKDMECPKAQHAARVGECQADTTPRGGSVRMSATQKEETYLISVDGKNATVGNFHLKIECDAF